jgi:uncharacterized protein (TIGR03084 family)
MAVDVSEVLDDLVAEYDRLDAILAALTPAQWAAPSAAPGWTVRDVVVHLAQTEEAVALTLAMPVGEWTARPEGIDAWADDQVRGDDAPADAVFARWQRARRASVSALATADPAVAVRWAAAPLRPKTLATTRLAEHWAHALDICGPLAIELADTDRLRHIAWLGHATLPYAMRLAGFEPVEVRAVLDGPSGARWAFGPSSAAATISGSVGAFCRVGAHRLAPGDSQLECSNDDAVRALSVLRNYAA